MRAPSFLCTRWKRTSFCSVALYSLTGIVTIPKLIAPRQIDRMPVGPPGTILAKDTDQPRLPHPPRALRLPTGLRPACDDARDGPLHAAGDAAARRFRAGRPVARPRDARRSLGCVWRAPPDDGRADARRRPEGAAARRERPRPYGAGRG